MHIPVCLITGTVPVPPGMNVSVSAISGARGSRPKPLTCAPPGHAEDEEDQECHVTDAVGLAPSLLPRPGAVAITVTTTALAGEWCGVERRVRPGVREWSGA